MEARVREHIRAERDERKRGRVDTTQIRARASFPMECYEAARGDFLLALALACDRISGKLDKAAA